jgi:5-formyltetrahydrofolate cyclo-ligase
MAPQTMTSKSEVRRIVLARRDALRCEERAARSARAGDRLLSLPEFRAAGMVMFFVSFGSEVATLPMISRALAARVRVAAPHTDTTLRALVPREVRDPQRDLRPGVWGIPEPGPDCPPVPLDGIEAVIVPAVAWDGGGFRVGYGGGYYDRFLPQVAAARWIGLGFELQVLPEVPRGRRDLPVDVLVTEEKVRRFRRGERRSDA